MRTIFTIIMILLSGVIASFAQDADDYWGQWHGPANGTACVPQAPGPDLHLAWSLNLMGPADNDSLIGNFGYHVTNIYNEGTLLRADDTYLYLKVNRDYSGAADPTVWRIDPATGNRLASFAKANGEDTWVSRAFQLYDSPAGNRALHAASFYGTYWDTANLDNDSTQKFFHDSHSCLGSRILMGKWAWKNNRFRSPHSISYYQGGELYWWNGSGYSVKEPEDFALIDHAWDDGKCVLFVLTGYEGGVAYEQARYWVLDNEGSIIGDSSIDDIYRPTGSYNWRPTNTDVVMKLALKGDYIYAIERTTSTETNLVRRQISADFVKTGQIPLGTSSVNRSMSYCIDDNALYLQWADKLTAYSLDLSTTLWEVDTPQRTMYHSDIQGFDYHRWPGTRNYSCQSIACNGQYIYSTTDDRLQVHRATDGELLYQYIFTNLPHKASHEEYYRVIGEPGDIVIMPDCIAVLSRLNSTRVWAFTPNLQPDSEPVLVDPPDEHLVVYSDNMISYQMNVTQGHGPYTWQIDPATDDSVESLLSISDLGEVTGWTPTVQDAGTTVTVVASVSNSSGSDTISFNAVVIATPATGMLCDFSGGNTIGIPGFDSTYYNSSYARVSGQGRYFRAGEQLKLYYTNNTDSYVQVEPQLSFTYSSAMTSTSTVRMQFIPMGNFYLGANSSTVKTFTLNKVDEGWHTLVNIWHKNAVLDKIEIYGTFLNPMPDAGDECYGIVGQPVTLDGSGSSNPVNGSLEFEWNFDDQTPFGSTAVVEHTYAQTGDYTVSLRVRYSDEDWSIPAEAAVHIVDNDGDLDNDGLTNIQEINLGTRMDSNDSDLDGMSDGWEVDNNLDPVDSDDAYTDPDNDGVQNYIEAMFESNPHVVDTDNDGQTDWYEIVGGSNPSDPESKFVMHTCSLTQSDNDTAMTITWTAEYYETKYYTYYIVSYKDTADSDWTQVEWSDFYDTLTYNDDGTLSWTDRSPQDASQVRMYRVTAISYISEDGSNGGKIRIE